MKLVESEWKILGDRSAVEKLNCLKGPLKKWNKEVFGSINDAIGKLEVKVSTVDKSFDIHPMDKMLIARRRALLSQLDIWYKRKGEFWKQHAREKFITKVDKNSKYFHTMATIKRRKT